MKKLLFASLIVASITQAYELNTQMQEYMNTLKSEAKKQNPNFKEFSYERGEKIFTSEHIGKKGKLISCVTCHTNDLSAKGINKHKANVIDPLSPSANSERFSDVKNVKKWLRRNFKDVYKRAGSAQEKGDVVTYIIHKK